MTTMVSEDKKIVPGSILCGNVGYSMIIPVFYEVLGITPSGKSARIREIKSATVSEDNCFQGSCVPVPGAYVGKTETRRIKAANWGLKSGPFEYVSDGQHIFDVWNGKAQHFDYLD